MTATPLPPERATRYEFLVAGALSEAARAVFPEFETTKGAAGGTVLFGVVEDSAHLHGLLDRFQTLGLAVLEMRRLPD